MQQDLEHLGITYVNLTSSTTKGLEEKQMDPDLEVILTNVEALADKEKRYILPKSRNTIGHIGWDEAMVT